MCFFHPTPVCHLSHLAKTNKPKCNFCSKVNYTKVIPHLYKIAPGIDRAHV